MQKTSSLLVANWKMHGNLEEWADLTNKIGKGVSDVECEVVICPPDLGLATVKKTIATNGYKLNTGVQNIHHEEKGPYTGDISAVMAKSCGADYAIIGHSERREAYKESEYQISHKAIKANYCRLNAIVCIGETLAQKEEGLTIATLDNQIFGCLDNVFFSKPKELVIAYEPIWAIGSGKKPTVEELTEVFRFLRKCMVDKYGELGYDVRLLYGGSANANNIEEIMSVEHINGALVGGASLNAEEFVKMANIIG